MYFCAPQSQQFLKLMNTDSFALRHIGPRPENISEMLKTIGVDSLDQFIYETLPDGIKLEKELTYKKLLKLGPIIPDNIKGKITLITKR